VGDLDTTMRLRLDQDIDREAAKGEKALKELRAEAKKLGRSSGADELDRDLGKVGRGADRARADVSDLRKEADRLNRIRTDAAEREMRALGRAADRTEGKLRDVNRVQQSGKVNALVGPMGRLHSAAVGVAGGLVAAFGTQEILRNMGAMKERADELQASLTGLLLIEGEFSPERRAAMQRRNDKLGIRYGMTQDAILGAQTALAQGGLVGDTQDAVLGPILKASKASGSSPEVIATAVRALVQNLGVATDDIPTALDAMLAGGKFGSFEIEDMARDFPSLAAVYANSGRSGLDAVRELVAMAQIVRENTGTSGEAGTALNEILSKIYSPEILKRMEENGINVERLDRQAKADNVPLISKLIEKIEAKGLTDQFGLGELVGDKNARQALQALVSKADKYAELLDQVTNESAGSVDEDYAIVEELPGSRADRRSAALGATGRGIGERITPLVDAIMDGVVATLSTDYARQLRFADKDSLDINKRIRAAQDELQLIEDNPGFVPGGQFQQAELKQQIRLLEAQLRTMEELRGLPKGALTMPDIDTPGAALGDFNEKLDAELAEAEAKVQAAAARMKQALGFTAFPTIVPRGGSVRDQNRAVRSSQNGALHETGAPQ